MENKAQQQQQQPQQQQQQQQRDIAACLMKHNNEFVDYMTHDSASPRRIMSIIHLALIRVFRENMRSLNRLSGIELSESFTAGRVTAETNAEPSDYTDLREHVLFIEEMSHMKRNDCRNGIRIKIELLFLSFFAPEYDMDHHHADFDFVFTIVDEIIDKYLLVATTVSTTDSSTASPASPMLRHTTLRMKYSSFSKPSRKVNYFNASR